MFNNRRSYYSSSSSDSLPLWAIGGLAAVCVGIAVAANYESSEDRARKPEVIERILEASYERCSLTNDFNGASYAYRFEQTLNEAYTSDLEKIEDAGIQICLDERLDEQIVGFFDHRVSGIYYPDEQILSIYDVGTDINGMFNSLSLYGERVPAEFVDDVLEGSLSLDEMAVSYKYSASCGKNCTTTKIRFRDAGRVESELNNNPELREAPIHSSATYQAAARP